MSAKVFPFINVVHECKRALPSKALTELQLRNTAYMIFSKAFPLLYVQSDLKLLLGELRAYVTEAFELDYITSDEHFNLLADIGAWFEHLKLDPTTTDHRAKGLVQFIDAFEHAEEPSLTFFKEMKIIDILPAATLAKNIITFLSRDDVKLFIQQTTGDLYVENNYMVGTPKRKEFERLMDLAKLMGWVTPELSEAYLVQCRAANGLVVKDTDSNLGVFTEEELSLLKDPTLDAEKDPTRLFGGVNTDDK